MSKTGDIFSLTRMEAGGLHSNLDRMPSGREEKLRDAWSIDTAHKHTNS